MPQQGSTRDISLHVGGGAFSFIPARYILAFLCYLGIILQFAMNALFSVAIVAMVKTENKTKTESWILNNKDKSQHVCPGNITIFSSDYQEGEFYWNEDIQGYILSSYYYGYCATQLLGGRLSEIYGSKVVAGPGIFIAGFMTMLSPLAARLNAGVLMAARVLVGAGSGVFLSSVTNLLTKWFVPEEVNFIGGIIIAGGPVGTVLGMTLSGFINEVGGWSLIFYIFGVAITFIAPWLFLVYDSPEKHPRISEAEKKYILSVAAKTSEVKKLYPVPWFAILTSWPLWVHIINGMGHGWVGFILLSDMPTYLSRIHHFEVKKSGMISALPYVTSGITGIVSSYASNRLHRNGYISQLSAYRIFNAISFYGSSLCLLGITFSGCNSTIIVILLICVVGITGFYLGGSILNQVDLGNNFAGTTSGIYLTLNTVMGIFSPSITGIIINNQETLSQWSIVFYLGAGIPSFCCTLFILFGRVEEQYWNILPSPETEQNSQDIKQRT